jgi:hypothetical protein
LAVDGQRCPIGRRTVDSSASRIASLLVTALLLTALFTPAKWVLLVVLADYLLRDLAGPGKSPLCWLGGRTKTALGLRGRPVDAAPKRFAAWLATGFVGAGALAVYVADALPMATVAVGACAVCAFLDGAFGYCVGCRVYVMIQGARRAIDGVRDRFTDAPPAPVSEPVPESRRKAA